jgi:hypothetical protein
MPGRDKCDRCCHLEMVTVCGPMGGTWLEAHCGYSKSSQPLGTGNDTTTPKWCPMKHMEDWG